MIESNDPAALFLPTLVRAQAQGLSLPEGRIAEERRMSALIVHATILRRKTWSEEKVLPPSLISSIPEGEPPPPDDLEARTSVRLLNVTPMAACSACVATPGRRKCRVCGGVGTLAFSNVVCSCDKGFIKCPSCDGGVVTNRVRLSYFIDEPAWMCEAYLPSELLHEPSLFGLESAFEKTIEFRNEIDECLRCHDLSDTTQGTAYRGGSKKKAPDFKGYDFADTVDKALAGLAALGAGMQVVRYAIRAYAWPVLWLRYEYGPNVVVFAGRYGSLVSFSGAQ
ncbi:MAG: hypothetical protein HUU21_01905 [Polyangiaceae bacterium]|nr:hypothetical protein [Polyangiaceae bacterium]NUQ72289.1 hypothetical protein [Polyangiaceae bacterium]